jgi:hypothetical protein
MRLEATNGVPAAHARTLDFLENEFNEAGVEIIGAPNDQLGMRLNVSKQVSHE